MITKEQEKRIDRLVKKYADIFKALERYDLGTYKRSMVVRASKRIG